MGANSAEQAFTTLSLHLLAVWITLLCLLAGTICIVLRLRLPTCSKPAASTSDDVPDQSPPMHRGVHLVEVTRDRNEANTDIDIIAIHGLDTTSQDTWTWKDVRDPNNSHTRVNWLHPGMLPESVDRVRIFTCDWPADLLVPSNSIPKTIEEHALVLLEGIRNTLFTRSARQQDRYIVFIASCLGGLILTRALVRADDERSEYYRIRVATRGIVFLATPFRGTTFQEVAAWAGIGLKAKASLQGRAVSRLIDSVNGSTFELQESIRGLTKLCQHKDNPCEVFAFYEMGTTSLLYKTFPWLPGWFHQRRLLVDRSSATLDIIPDPLPLDRPHSLMNKFRDSQCPDYRKVVAKIRGMVENIIAGNPLQQADKFICDEHYTTDRLKIERLSGELLPMDLCYINLAIVEQSGQYADRSKKGGTARSPFTLFSRQKIEVSDNGIMVELAAVFNERMEVDGRPMRPRRVLIRGHAGVGKTTLCKKIVYDFTHGIESELYRVWRNLFDRVLWIPLRRLKIQPAEGWNLESLFYYEYFKKKGGDEGRRLARELSRSLLDPSNGRTLFILDGLDEVSGVWATDDYRTEFLSWLLNQPDVIITSRPSGTFPVSVHDADLELETIGFYPNQVNGYIEKTFSDREKGGKVQSFLQKHWLIQGLVRIPIQLDALCYTWDDLRPDDIPDTMTGMYKEIELKLWKKDALRLEKTHDNKVLTEEDLKRVGSQKIKRILKEEMAFIESLAFTGLYNDETEFSSEHLDSISDHFTPSLLPDKMLPLLSFLRTSDPPSKYYNRTCHFIHLTFQEYFAARYFMRQWKESRELQFIALGSNGEIMPMNPAEFLQKHKYTARYDIFWRFVAGLLDICGQAPRFINTIEQEPLDVLGPTHQRLVMHCLSEISSTLPGRKALEERLSQWLLFECEFNGSARLASEVEFPGEALEDALIETLDIQCELLILRSLANRAFIPLNIIKYLALLISHPDSDVRRAAATALGRHQGLPDYVLPVVTALLNHEDNLIRLPMVKALGRQAKLSDEELIAVAGRLYDDDESVRSAASEALDSRTALSNDVFMAVVRWLGCNNISVRNAVVETLNRQAALPNEVLMAVARYLKHQNKGTRIAAVRALGQQAALPNEVLMSVVGLLNDQDNHMQIAAVEALGWQPALSNQTLMAVAKRLEYQDKGVQIAAIKALGQQATLPDEVLMLVVGRLNDQDKDIQIAAIETLDGQAALPDKVLTAFAVWFKHQHRDTQAPDSRAAVPDKMFRAAANWLNSRDWDIQNTAIKTLDQQVVLTNEMLRAEVGRLNHKDIDIQRAAIQAMARQAALPNEVLMIVAKRLTHQDWGMRSAAIKALERQAALSDEVLEAVAERLNHQDLIMQSATIQILSRQTVLPDQVLIVVVRQLNNQNGHIRRAAIQAIDGQMVLSDKVLIEVARLLPNLDYDERYATIKALSRQAILSNKIPIVVVGWLNHQDISVQMAAIKILGGLTALTDEVLITVVEWFDHQIRDVRAAAVMALDKRAALPDRVLVAVARRLGHQDWDVRSAAVRILDQQKALPDEMYMAVAGRLDDPDKYTRRVAIKFFLRNQEKFRRTSFKESQVASLYEALLERSFEEQLSWYVKEDYFCINISDSIREFPVDIRQNQVRKWINRARPAACPLASNGENLSNN